MKKLSESIPRAIERMGGDSDKARINMRTHEVREHYKKALEMVYRETAALHLAHTNNVIITVHQGIKTLTVYVDDSLFAAELNAQRELIKLHLLEMFGEEIEDFEIKISRWKKYREHHPYLLDEQEFEKKVHPRSLNTTEKKTVEETSTKIKSTKLRESFKKAMTADLEWKKGEKVDCSPKK